MDLVSGGGGSSGGGNVRVNTRYGRLLPTTGCLPRMDVNPQSRAKQSMKKLHLSTFHKQLFLNNKIMSL